MNRNINILLLIVGSISLAIRTPAQTRNDEVAIKQRIIGFFDGVAKLDEGIIRSGLTKDFQLLEQGLVWNADSLIAVLKNVNKAAFVRTNRFEFINVQQRGDVAWVSYWNYADIRLGDRKFKRKWLESAVLLEESGTWRIAFLHSTKMEE
jgi:hypothetical protein